MGKSENRMSEKGEYKGHGKRPAERVSKIEDDHVGSSKGSGGIRFPLSDHHGIGGEKTPEHNK